MTRRIVISLAFLLVPFGHTASAHHNMTALFDFNDRVTLTGTLSQVDWRNPHTYLTLDVKNAKGAMESWSAEGPSPSWFRIRDIGKAARLALEAVFACRIYLELHVKVVPEWSKNPRVLGELGI